MIESRVGKCAFSQRIFFGLVKKFFGMLVGRRAGLAQGAEGGYGLRRGIECRICA